MRAQTQFGHELKKNSVCPCFNHCFSHVFCLLRAAFTRSIYFIILNSNHLSIFTIQANP